MSGERNEGASSAPSALEAIRARALAAARKPAEIMTSVAEEKVQTARDRRSRAKQFKEGFEAPRPQTNRPVSLMEVESLLGWVDFGIESSKHPVDESYSRKAKEVHELLGIFHDSMKEYIDSEPVRKDSEEYRLWEKAKGDFERTFLNDQGTRSIVDAFYPMLKAQGAEVYGAIEVAAATEEADAFANTEAGKAFLEKHPELGRRLDVRGDTVETAEHIARQAILARLGKQYQYVDQSLQKMDSDRALLAQSESSLRYLESNKAQATDWKEKSGIDQSISARNTEIQDAKTKMTAKHAQKELADFERQAILPAIADLVSRRIAEYAKATYPEDVSKQQRLIHGSQTVPDVFNNFNTDYFKAQGYQNKARQPVQDLTQEDFDRVVYEWKRAMALADFGTSARWVTGKRDYSGTVFTHSASDYYGPRKDQVYEDDGRLSSTFAKDVEFRAELQALQVVMADVREKTAKSVPDLAWPEPKSELLEHQQVLLGGESGNGIRPSSVLKTPEGVYYLGMEDRKVAEAAYKKMMRAIKEYAKRPSEKVEVIATIKDATDAYARLQANTRLEIGRLEHTNTEQTKTIEGQTSELAQARDAEGKAKLELKGLSDQLNTLRGEIGGAKEAAQSARGAKQATEQSLGEQIAGLNLRMQEAESRNRALERSSQAMAQKIANIKSLLEEAQQNPGFTGGNAKKAVGEALKELEIRV